jgi:hypothetical protein
MGWAASPARVIVPFRLSQGSVIQYDSRLFQILSSDDMVWNTELKRLNKKTRFLFEIVQNRIAG